MNRDRATAIVAAGPRPPELRYTVRLIVSKQGFHWARIHSPGAGELIGRCEVIEREPLFGFRSHKPKHRKAWWKR